MNAFIVRTMYDIRGGRQTWRVFALVCLPAFAAGIVAGVVRLG
ncbi:MAG TPA: hypothetical protein VHW00_04295 [Thermoanaerobaculia bacterium]|nr:hypothetical protein [Thermoanaerobaculia bacterium]